MPLSLRACSRSQRQGAVTAWLVASLGVIIAIVALGLDGGRMLDERRHAQAAADAAALAAATDLYNNYPSSGGTDPNGTAKQAALDSAASNGYLNDGSTCTVTVNVPPTSGTFAGQTGYVEVILQVKIKGSFSAAIQGGDLPLQARAVARGQPQKLGLLTLQALGVTVSASGNANLKVVNGPLQVNSSDPAAVSVSGNATVQASAINLVGGALGISTSANVPVASGATSAPDPLRYLPPPNPANYTLCSTQPLLITSTTILQPGIYVGGIFPSGNATVTLSPGVYILQGGGLVVSGNASVTGTGVMLYNTSGSFPSGMIYATGNGQISLTPATSGTYAGISIFQDRSVNIELEADGNGKIQVSGLIYAMAAAIETEGNGSITVGNGAIICSSIAIAGSGSIAVDATASYAKCPDVRLVE